MDRDMAAEKCMIVDADVAAEHDIVGERDFVTNVAIVADMAPDHERAAIADAGDAATVFGAGVHGHALAQVAVRADDEFGCAAAIIAPIAAAFRATRNG